MQFYKAKQDLCSRLDINFDEIEYNGLIDESDLGFFLNEAQTKIYDKHNWKLGQVKESITNTEASSYAYPKNVKTGSIRYLLVSGKPWSKLDYESYLDYLSDVEDGNASDEETYYSEYNRTIYINDEAYESTDTIEVIGDRGISNLENSTDLLIFSHGSTLSGTATFTNADATVTASTAIFSSDMVGGTIDVDGVRYTVDSFTSTTEIELTAVYAGTTGSKSFTMAYNDTYNSSANDAIVQYAYGEILKSEKKQQPDKGKLNTDEALASADRVWQEQSGHASREQTTKEMFNRINLR